MTDKNTEPKRRPKETNEASDPAHVVREGAIAASIWRRHSPSGYPYYDFSLSRSWKSQASGKTGYSKNFFDRNRVELLAVVEQACAWISEQATELEADRTDPLAA